MSTHPADLTLAEQDRRRIAAHAAAAVRAAVLGDPPPAGEELGAAGATVVSGLFVSLHQGERLRGCIGTLGRPLRVAEVLAEEARAAALSDRRFAPLGAAELDGLTIEAWLLYAWEELPADPARRRELIVLGRDGLQLACAGRRGVFLPSVPVEAGWDLDQYLAHLGAKAGLDDHAWLRPGSVMHRFRGICLRHQNG